MWNFRSFRMSLQGSFCSSTLLTRSRLFHSFKAACALIDSFDFSWYSADFPDPNFKDASETMGYFVSFSLNATKKNHRAQL